MRISSGDTTRLLLTAALFAASPSRVNRLLPSDTPFILPPARCTTPQPPPLCSKKSNDLALLMTLCAVMPVCLNSFFSSGDETVLHCIARWCVSSVT
ncbi:hypothetical protein EDB85DRAFT_1983649 [Lactarius pseudohatsudake]|nr:hypothetical protein EDB85DRAFT_1983649 [Lactarius pseudohatsudake]